MIYQYSQLYQLGGVGGYGRKIYFVPGRCRQTDGKKWRCAKEYYPDFKYCETHLICASLLSMPLKRRPDSIIQISTYEINSKGKWERMKDSHAFVYDS